MDGFLTLLRDTRAKNVDVPMRTTADLTRAGKEKNEWGKANIVLKNPTARASLVNSLRDKGYDVDSDNVESFIQEKDVFPILAELYFDQLLKGASAKGFNLNSMSKELLTKTPSGDKTNYRMKLLRPQSRTSGTSIATTFKGGKV